jgi:hypothetical protein
VTPIIPENTAVPSVWQPLPQAGQRLSDEREALGEVVARPTVEPHAVAVLAGDHAETVVVDLVQPQLAGRRARG